MDFKDTDLNIEGQITIDQLTIKEEDGKIPTYEVTLREDKEVGTIQKIQQQISSLESGNGGSGAGMTVSQVKSQIAAEGSKYFLSKLSDDVSQGLITFLKGVKIGAENLWRITKDGFAYLSNLSVKGSTSLGENGTETTFGDYHADSTGAAVKVKSDGTSIAEFDYITIRRAADFRSITIHELRYIGGELAITPAAMQVSKVERLDSNGNVLTDDDTTEPNKYKCYFDTTDTKGEKKAYNEFMVGDQARCQQFGISEGTHEFVKTKYYWRLVLEVGEDYIVLSNVDKDPLTTSEPAVNDNIVQLGYRHNDRANRQSAIILSATSSDAPSQKYYQGINDYSLDHVVKDEGYDAALGVFHCNVYGDSYTGDKDGQGYFKYDSKTKKATFKGTVNFESDSTLPDGSSIDEIAKKEDLEGLNIKSGNLLRNTAFTGDFESIEISEDMDVSEGKETYSEKMKYWNMTSCKVNDDTDSTSGKSVLITNGSLSQQLVQPLIADGDYTISFKGKGTRLTIEVAGNNITQDMTSGMARYEVHFTCKDVSANTLTMSGDSCTVCEVMLTYGTIAPAWSPAYSDNDKSMSEFQNLKFLTDAISEGSTTVDGGLVMSQQFRVGNYRDKRMVKETGGMSGYYNDDNSPFLWGGGSLEQAIYTILKYKDNPNHEPTEEEVQQMAKFVVTHGGRAILNDIILRGYIYAEGGVMKSIKSPNGNFEIDEQGNTKLKGEVEASGGKIGGFNIDRNYLWSGLFNKWSEKDCPDMAQLGWNSLKIAQKYSYGDGTLSSMKIGIGKDSDPNPEYKGGEEVWGASAFYIYRKMNAAFEENWYIPAAKVISDNVVNRNVAMQLVGGLQVHGGIMETGRILKYSKENGGTNKMNLSFGSTFVLVGLSNEIPFFIPSYEEVCNQIGIEGGTEFCTKIHVICAKNSNKVYLCNQSELSTNPINEDQAGRFYDYNGNIWSLENRGMEQGDSFELALMYVDGVGYYAQVLNNSN